jgi:hypothetical protein
MAKIETKFGPLYHVIRAGYHFDSMVACRGEMASFLCSQSLPQVGLVYGFHEAAPQNHAMPSLATEILPAD